MTGAGSLRSSDEVAALRAEVAELRSLLETQPDIIYRVTVDGRIEFCATSSTRDLLRPPGELIGRRIDRCPDRATSRSFRSALDLLGRSGRPQSFEYELSPGGREISFYEARLLPMGEGRCLVVIRNVDQRRQLQIQLLQAQRLESIGHLAAGIAHEINTPTQYITDNVQFLLDSWAGLVPFLEAASTHEPPNATVLAALAKDVELPYLCEEIPVAIRQSLEGLGRIARIVGAMKEFSHPGSGAVQPADLNRALQNTVTVSRNEWKYTSELDLDLDPSLPPVRCMAAELGQVFLNLIVNASHAVADAVARGLRPKGRIGITTRRDGDWAEIRISDTGTGIPAPVRDRIFDPFFTTKEVGKGTGQGLAISRAVVVEKHGGEIYFQTEEGQGTTFVIRVPIEGPAAGTGARAA